MTFTAPVFWYQHQGPRAHQLPDARSDVKGRTVLRKIRAGYATISPQRTASPRPSLQEVLPETQLESQPEPVPEPAPEPQAVPQEDPFADVEEPSQDERPLTPPDYESIEPPPYVRALPPSPPGYTPLPDIVSEPGREDLTQALKQRKRYRDALRRRLTSTMKIFQGDDSDAESSGNDLLSESESTRGVVMYRDNDQWVGTTNRVRNKGEAVPKQRGIKGLLKRIWQRCADFSAEHPWLFILAIFVIVVVVLCLLI